MQRAQCTDVLVMLVPAGTCALSCMYMCPLTFSKLAVFRNMYHVYRCAGHIGPQNVPSDQVYILVTYKEPVRPDRGKRRPLSQKLYNLKKAQ